LMTFHGIAPGGLAAAGNSSAGDTVWASEPSRNLVVRIDEHLRRIVQRIHTPTTPTRLAADDHAVWVAARDWIGPDSPPSEPGTPAARGGHEPGGGANRPAHEQAGGADSDAAHADSDHARRRLRLGDGAAHGVEGSDERRRDGLPNRSRQQPHRRAYPAPYA